VQFTKVPRHVFADPPYVPALEPPAQSLAQDVLIPPRKKWPQRRVLTSAFTSKRRLADDLTELGDNATAALVRQAIDCFQAWKFEAGEELLERALEERHRHEHEPPRSPYFNTCVLVLA